LPGEQAQSFQFVEDRDQGARVDAEQVDQCLLADRAAGHAVAVGSPRTRDDRLARANRNLADRRAGLSTVNYRVVRPGSRCGEDRGKSLLLGQQ
jgi:hypothetical protein